jgi:hypothetical protein
MYNDVYKSPVSQDFTIFSFFGLSNPNVSWNSLKNRPEAKQFLDKPGIPMPPIPRFRATLCCRWLLLVFILIGGLGVRRPAASHRHPFFEFPLNASVDGSPPPILVYVDDELKIFKVMGVAMNRTS